MRYVKHTWECSRCKYRESADELTQEQAWAVNGSATPTSWSQEFGADLCPPCSEMLDALKAQIQELLLAFWAPTTGPNEELLDSHFIQVQKREILNRYLKGGSLDLDHG